jgi:hypothetical protein
MPRLYRRWHGKLVSGVKDCEDREMVVFRKTLWGFVLVVGLAIKLSAQSYEEMGVNQKYFPKGIFAQGKSDGDFVAGWYSSQLRAMKEPSLSASPTSEQATTYRFTWLRTFHHPLVARFVLNGSGSGTLYVKMADGAGGYNPGKVVLDSTFALKQDEVQKILSLLGEMEFWHAPTELLNGPSGCDGSQWILEGRDKLKYHVIDRWTPQSGPLRELGLYLVLDIAKLDIPKREVY